MQSNAEQEFCHSAHNLCRNHFCQMTPFAVMIVAIQISGACPVEGILLLYAYCPEKCADKSCKLCIIEPAIPIGPPFN